VTPVQVAPVDAAAVQRYADAMMVFIGEDVTEGAVPVSVASFGELHSHCDANMFYEDAGQVYDGSLESIAEIAAIADEITRRIQDGALVADLLAGQRPMTASERRQVAMIYRIQPRPVGDIAAYVIEMGDRKRRLIAQLMELARPIEDIGPPEFTYEQVMAAAKN
jgi:hypothetical protein